MSCQVFYEVSFYILSCHVKWFLCLTMSHLIISMSVVSMSISAVSMSMSVVCIARRKVDCTCSYVNISRLNLAKLIFRNTTVCLRMVVIILWWQRNRRWRRWCRWQGEDSPVRGPPACSRWRGRAEGSGFRCPSPVQNIFHHIFKIFFTAYDTVSDVVESKVHQCQQNSDA